MRPRPGAGSCSPCACCRGQCCAVRSSDTPEGPAMLRDWIALARPLHWSKNAFVLMPIPFALAAGASVPRGRLLAGLVAFSLANSAVYAFNDAQDAARDRMHKTKKERPV